MSTDYPIDRTSESTIDKTNAEAHRAYAQAAISGDDLLTRDSRQVSQATQRDMVTAIPTAEDTLFRLTRPVTSWSRISPPPGYSTGQARLFKHTMLEGLGTPMEQRARIERVANTELQLKPISKEVQGRRRSLAIERAEDEASTFIHEKGKMTHMLQTLFVVNSDFNHATGMIASLKGS